MLKITKRENENVPDFTLCNCCGKNKTEFVLRIGNPHHSALHYFCAECIWDLKDLIDATTFVKFVSAEKEPGKDAVIKPDDI